MNEYIREHSRCFWHRENDWKPVKSAPIKRSSQVNQVKRNWMHAGRPYTS